ncbi:MAG: SGNH/GDSL hydrolase family protein [Pseudomonadota bacterium]
MRLLLVFGSTTLILLAASLVWLAPPCALGQCEAGARDRTFAHIDRLPNPLRVTVMGTSLTARGTWPDALTSELATCLDVPVSVTRIAKGGETSRWGKEETEAVIASAPDILLIEFTINDADLRHGVSLAESAQNQREIIAEVQRTLPRTRIALMTLNRAYYRRALVRPLMRRYESQYDRLAADLDVGRLNLLPEWHRAVAENGLSAAIPDGVHPAPAVAERVNVPAIAGYIDASCAAG